MGSGFARWLFALIAMTAVVAHAEDAPRPVAAATAAMLAPAQPQILSVPEWLHKRVKGPMVIFYFSPACPHCQDVMPAVNRLGAKVDIPWFGISTTSSTRMEIDGFKTEYGAKFEVVQDDEERGFARALGALSTPSVYLVAPAPQGSDPGTIEVTEAYAPFSRGIEGIFLLRRNKDNPFGDFATYQGLQTCGGCHIEEARSWAMTHHAVAYRTLYVRDRARDLSCVGCHVTGLDEPGGFVVGDHGSAMRDVTCESCHGIGGPHNPERATPVDAKTTCIGCHDEEHSIAFSVDKGLPHIDHFASVSTSEEDVRARIEALLLGEAPRPLLAFPDGPTVGSATCRSCHKTEHKAWKKSDHGRAMEALESADAERVDCVRCHATQSAYGGPESTAIDGFRLDEGVGCESCHGPGGDHAKQPAKDNIVGLGSSCPECVIEAICTSCHTPKWDAGWELQTRLRALQH